MLRKLFPLDDLRSFFQSRSTHQLWAAGLSVGMTIVVMTGFLIENRSGYMKPDPVLVYVQSWPASRTEADVKAQQATELAARLAALKVQKAEEAAAKAAPKAVPKA